MDKLTEMYSSRNIHAEAAKCTLLRAEMHDWTDEVEPVSGMTHFFLKVTLLFLLLLKYFFPGRAL